MDLDSFSNSFISYILHCVNSKYENMAHYSEGSFFPLLLPLLFLLVFMYKYKSRICMYFLHVQIIFNSKFTHHTPFKRVINTYLLHKYKIITCLMFNAALSCLLTHSLTHSSLPNPNPSPFPNDLVIRLFCLFVFTIQDFYYLTFKVRVIVHELHSHLYSFPHPFNASELSNLEPQLNSLDSYDSYMNSCSFLGLS